LLKIGLPILLAVLPLGAKAAETIPEVFIIHSYHSGLSWTDSIMNGSGTGLPRDGSMSRWVPSISTPADLWMPHMRVGFGNW
jgi:hypothetical protein